MRNFRRGNRVSIHARARAFLESAAKRQILITYQELANALQILPPHSIHRVTEALERLMEEDAAADRPFIAALGRFGRQLTTRTSCSPKLTRMLTETNPTLTGAADCPDPHQSQQRESMSGSGYPKFKNDRGVPEICIGVKEFMCIGESPPQDHPHVYINMGEANTILCPYCATRFRFDPRLTPLDADPPDSFFADHNAV